MFVKTCTKINGRQLKKRKIHKLPPGLTTTQPFPRGKRFECTNIGEIHVQKHCPTPNAFFHHININTNTNALPKMICQHKTNIYEKRIENTQNVNFYSQRTRIIGQNVKYRRYLIQT